jgi:serine/threonine protein kinase
MALANGRDSGCEDNKQGKDAKLAHDFKGTRYWSQVKREVKILKFLRHPHIIRLYEVLHNNRDIFVAMEMARGG